MSRLATDELNDWAVGARAGASELRAAIEDLKGVRAMTPDASETLRVEYLALSNSMESPNFRSMIAPDVLGSEHWWEQLPAYSVSRSFLNRDQERTRRLARILFANWLTYRDGPSAAGPQVGQGASSARMLFQPKADAPARVRRNSPARWADWFDRSPASRILLPDMMAGLQALDRDVRELDMAIMTLANELYRRGHEGQEAATYRALIDGGYLDRLPDHPLDSDQAVMEGLAGDGG